MGLPDEVRVSFSQLQSKAKDGNAAVRNSVEIMVFIHQLLLCS